MMETLAELLNRHYNDYIQIDFPYQNDVKSGKEWLKYFDDDIELWDVVAYDDDADSDYYDIYISIR